MMINKTTDLIKSLASLISSIVQLAILAILIGGGIWTYRTYQSIRENGISLPTIKVPDIELPKMKMPDIEMPSVRWPAFDLSGMFGEKPDPNNPYNWTLDPEELKEKEEWSGSEWEFNPPPRRTWKW